MVVASESNSAASLWLIPVFPLAAAAISAVLKQAQRRLSAALAIGSMALAFLFSCAAFSQAVSSGAPAHATFNFPWFQVGDSWLELGLLLDPLTAVMLVMVSFVGLLIFIYSTGYMTHDQNFTRFFCFLSLFAAAMLGLIVANSLLLFFICWELVGLTSYLLIGFWYHKPSAAAAAKKAFVTTRVGDLAFLLGMVWLYSRSGTLLFYAGGKGCLEAGGVVPLTAVGLLIFGGAVGKSGQLPLHVWLPDAMEGPTPVSALIHAATMVAAGVFLVARVYPIMTPDALTVVTWVGTLTALFAASIAVAQTDIKRILAWSTVSQLGFMMLGLGTGGVAVGMFHLLTHACFKALLFLGAGSVIHGCHEEQDIRRMGGLRRAMPVTFATYGAGMLALSGFPVITAGFWSKDEILHSAHAWSVSAWPFYLGLAAAFLTAFYMTRQVVYVFFGSCRLQPAQEAHHADPVALPNGGRRAHDPSSHSGSTKHEDPHSHSAATPQESPRVMLVPLAILAVLAIGLGFLGTPAWPWMRSFLEAHALPGGLEHLLEPETLHLMAVSSFVALAGIGLGWWVYGRGRKLSAETPDPLVAAQPEIFTLLRRQYYVDEMYEWCFVGLHAWWARVCVRLDAWLWGLLVLAVKYAVIGLSWVNRTLDEFGINWGFDRGCDGLVRGGGSLSLVQNGSLQRYLRLLALAMAALVLFFLWGCGAS